MTRVDLDLFTLRSTLASLVFAWEKVQIIIFFENRYSLRSQNWLKHSTNELMKRNEYQRSRLFFDLGRRSLSDQNYNLFFSDTVGSFETKFHMKVYWTMGMIIYTNDLSHTTNVAAMLIYSKKNNNKSSSPEPMDRWS